MQPPKHTLVLYMPMHILVFAATPLHISLSHTSPPSVSFMLLLCFFYLWCGVRLTPLGLSATVGPIVAALDDRGVLSSWWSENWQGKLKKTMPLFQPKILHYLTCDQSQAAAVGIQLLCYIQFDWFCFLFLFWKYLCKCHNVYGFTMFLFWGV